MEIKQYRTDIGNWGEEGTLVLQGSITLDLTHSFLDVLRYVDGLDVRPPYYVIVKTSRVSEERPGAWYITGLKHTTVDYETIQRKCEENVRLGLWTRRECYLIQYIT